MKKVIFLMLAITMSLGLISCSSDDDNTSNEPQFNIVGTWKVTQIFINGVESDVNNYCSYRGTFQFINPNTFVENGFELVENNCTAKETAAGTWTKSGNSYTIANVTSTVLPATFTPITTTSNISKFELNLSAGGIPTRLIFTKQ
ncbi:lipocalin-like domain-containing protein [Moheibacter sediminis]|nr:lipocalin family protein [Moheibacter sediminis]